MHKDFWNNQNRPKVPSCQKGISDILLKGDPDAAIILPLLLLLISDGGDEMLIMALLYILS